MVYWLVKSEPDVYSFAQFLRDKKTGWDGVRNHQAASYLRAMAKGDRVFFYHSNIGKEIVGIGTVARTAYTDPSDASGKFVMVDLADPIVLPKPVTLAAIKAEKSLTELPLLKQSRLSVMPIAPVAWRRLCQLGGVVL